jgi:hypothetical protein
MLNSSEKDSKISDQFSIVQLRYKIVNFIIILKLIFYLIYSYIVEIFVFKVIEILKFPVDKFLNY